MPLGSTIEPQLGLQARYWLRRICYSRPLLWLAQALLKPAAHEHQRYWDAVLSDGMVDYLGDTRSVIQSNAVIVGLLRIYGPQLHRVLDVGCAGGTLAYDLPPDVGYVGIDISAVAIEDALRRRAQRPPRAAPTAFHRASLVEFSLPDRAEYDAIVLSEVLYYLKPQTALEQVLRYSRALSSAGVIVVSMKHDPKSLIIFRQLESQLQWQGGVLYQPKVRIDFRVRLSHKSPAFLVSAFRRKM